MYEIIPTTKQDLQTVKKSTIQRINEIVSGTSARPFGFYDFIIVGTASFLYFLFTGIAVARGKTIPSKWMALAKKLDKGGIAKRVIKEPEKKPNFFKVETINKPAPIADAAGNPLKK